MEEFYEYPGVKLVYESAQAANRNDYIIYAHAKGLSHLVGAASKCPNDSCMASKMILKNSLNNIDILNTIPSLNKIGPGLGGSGWMWFNFYLSRASYIKSLDKPVCTTDRYYYERWLGTSQSDLSKFNDGLSLACWPYPTVSQSFSSQEMIDQTNQHGSDIKMNIDETMHRLLSQIG